MEKAALRAQIRAQKRTLSDRQIAAASEDLTRQLLEHPLYRRAKSLYAYLSYNQEVRTGAILQQALLDGKRLAVPKIFGDTMRFVRLDSDSRITCGYKGIPEPESDEIVDDPEALVLMPGLAFDREGHRMGYGGGFYDRFLAAQPHPTIALCYDFQLVDSLPVEAHDLPVDVVLWAKIPEVSV